MTRSIISLGILVLSVIIVVSFVLPRFQNVQDLKRQAEQLRGSLADAEATRQKWQATLASYNDIKTEDLERLHKMLPDTDDDLGIIIELNELTRQYGLELVGIESVYPSDEKDSPNAYKQFDIEMSVNGPYLNMTEFIERLERNLRIVDVTGIGFDAGRVQETGELTSEQLSEKENTDYTITLRTYWLP